MFSDFSTTDIIIRPMGEGAETGDEVEANYPIMDQITCPEGTISNARDGCYSIEEIYEEEIDPCTGVRCIKLYKPCAEGYIDADPCCPNTGNCVPDPDYVAIDETTLPVGETPSSQFITQTPIAISSSTRGGVSNSTTYRNTSISDSEPETETPAPEEPKESGIGIIALGLIALEVLAT